MTKVTLENCNEIIAEFMGWELEKGIFVKRHPVHDWVTHEVRYCKMKTYTESLDSLVPVWEKLGDNGTVKISMHDRFIKRVTCELYRYDGDKCKTAEKFEPLEEKSFSEVAAIATAKAIKELENG